MSLSTEYSLMLYIEEQVGYGIMKVQSSNKNTKYEFRKCISENWIIPFYY